MSEYPLARQDIDGFSKTLGFKKSSHAASFIHRREDSIHRPQRRGRRQQGTPKERLAR